MFKNPHHNLAAMAIAQLLVVVVSLLDQPDLGFAGQPQSWHGWAMMALEGFVLAQVLLTLMDPEMVRGAGPPTLVSPSPPIRFMTSEEIFTATCRANPHVDPEHIRQVLTGRPEYERRRKEFMDAYAKQHAACPDCGGLSGTVTLAGFPLDLDNPDAYRDLNTHTCDQCGDSHPVHERATR